MNGEEYKENYFMYIKSIPKRFFDQGIIWTTLKQQTYSVGYLEAYINKKQENDDESS